jgi:hypothetical protein
MPARRGDFSTPTPTPTPIPATLSISPRACTSDIRGTGCADEGFSLAYSNGVITAINSRYGYQVLLGQFEISRATDGEYVIAIYVKFTKIPSGMDTQHPYWFSDGGMFNLQAINSHPYDFSDVCQSPAVQSKDLYNGETNEGWVCSSDIDPANVHTTFTVYWSDGYINDQYNIPLVDLAVTAPSS